MTLFDVFVSFISDQKSESWETLLPSSFGFVIPKGLRVTSRALSLEKIPQRRNQHRDGHS